MNDAAEEKETPGRDAPPRPAVRGDGPMIAGWIVLVLALPIALFGAMLLPNEYKSWGLEATDCDGPLGVKMFAVPTLLIYGAGFATNLRRARRPVNLIVAILCLLVCIPSALNLVRAIQEERAQSWECDARP
jgi:hypothetical protein